VTPLFAAIGEILVDFTPVVEEGRTVGFRMHAGGSPCNVAVALARMGAQVEFAGQVSTDFFGRFLVEYLQQESVGTRYLRRSPAATTLAFVALVGGEPSFTFYGDRTADTLLRPVDLPAEIAATTVLHFGSISLLRGTTATTIAELVQCLRGRTLLSFDPNIRPSLIDDEPAYRQRLTRLFGAADIVKMSEADARWLAPGQTTEAVAEEVSELGPALVVITQGARGAYARTAALQASIAAPPVRVVDTVGAGDAFTAGLLFALARQEVTAHAAVAGLDSDGLDTALRFAAAAAALTCTRAGADPPRLEEIEGFLHR
jgi:fructokinase